MSMGVSMMKGKIHRATVTKADLDYEGSITVDKNLLDAAGILVHEKVDVLNITNGERFTTYTIAGEPGAGEIQVNGAAAHLVKPGHLVIIVAYCTLSEEHARAWQPKWCWWMRRIGLNKNMKYFIIGSFLFLSSCSEILNGWQKDLEERPNEMYDHYKHESNETYQDRQMKQ